MKALSLKPIFLGAVASAPGAGAAAGTGPFYARGDDLAGWQIAGGVFVDSVYGHPVPSFQVPGGAYAWRDIGFSFLGTTIEFQMRVMGGGMCNFFFGCNSGGTGNMFRFECRKPRPSGFATTSDWMSWNEPFGAARVTSNTWYAIRIEIRPAGVCACYYNGVQQVNGFVMGNQGSCLGLVGDDSFGGKYQDILVTQMPA